MSYDIKVGHLWTKKTKGLNWTWGYKSRAFMYLIPALKEHINFFSKHYARLCLVWENLRENVEERKIERKSRWTEKKNEGK